MEALGSPSISWAPMDGDHAIRMPKTSVCPGQVQRQYTIVRLPVSKFFLRLSCEKSVKSMSYLKHGEWTEIKIEVETKFKMAAIASFAG